MSRYQLTKIISWSLVLGASIGVARKMDRPATQEDSSDESENGADEASGIQSLLDMFAKKLGLSTEGEKIPPKKVLDEVTFSGIVNYMKSDKCKNIIIMTGAGISTSAGIPDFRSPGSGLYHNLQKYDLPHPQAIFEISYFKENPEPFFALAKELYPGSFKPTVCHYFIRLLHEKNLLTRLYTQNIDTLERIAGVPEDKIVEAHGSFFTSHCLNRRCAKEYKLEWMKEQIFADRVPKCTECGTVVKPDIVFFGENLPEKFFRCNSQDFKNCDLLIIMGTSLAVQPFASLIDQVSSSTPRLLINKEKAGEMDEMIYQMGFDGGLKFDAKDNYRDVAWIGTCDDGCQALAEALGWGDELESLVRREHDVIDKKEKDKSSEDSQKETVATTSK